MMKLYIKEFNIESSSLPHIMQSVGQSERYLSNFNQTEISMRFIVHGFKQFNHETIKRIEMNLEDLLNNEEKKQDEELSFSESL